MVEENEEAGFKQTEVGVIPNDWRVKKLGDVAEIKRGRFSPRPRNDPRFYGGNIPFVQTGDVTNSGGKISNYTQTLNKDGLNVSILFPKGIVLMTIAANIGYTGVLQIDMACPDSLVAITGLKNYDNNYLNCYFTYKRQALEQLSTPGAQKNLNVEILKSFHISLPPTKAEQTAIATALTDADTLVTQLEKLIAKKKAIKQGAMQELLKPREGWEVKKLGEISSIKTGPFGSTLHEKDYVADGTPIITVEHLGELGIVHEDMPMVSDFDRKRLSAYALQSDDIVFSRVGSVDRNSIVSKKEEGWLFSGRLLRIRINNKNVIPKYLSYHFHLENTKQRIRSVAVGQTMPSLNTQILSNIDIFLPGSTTEQTRIAKIFSDMDAEIDVLETKLEKQKMIKQGMMQVLLTGKIRLV